MAASDESETARVTGMKQGQICYLQIPALDLTKSAEFYETVFGWQIERPYPSFESPGLIGQWVTERAPAPDAGPLLWINVANIDQTLEAVQSSGGEVIAAKSQDGPRWLATIRDPAGNSIGIAQH
jgi:uncharacterized protein